MWKNIICNSNLVLADTGKSLLIKLPKSELAFWHPVKLCRFSGKNNYRLSFGYTDEFTFKCFRKSDKTGNILEERELNSTEIEEIFNSIKNESESKD